MQQRVYLAALLVLGCAIGVFGEKGDTYKAVLNATSLPPGSKYIPPTGKAAKQNFEFLMTDNGLSGNQTLKVSWTFSAPSPKYKFQTLDLVTTKLPGDPVFVNLYNFTYYDFYYFGNLSYGELSDGMVASGVCPSSGIVANVWCVDYTPIQDGSTYVIAVIDEANNTAVGGQLEYLPISVYGNGSMGSAGTQSSLVSSIVYIGTTDPGSVSFPNGFENGYIPMVNASAGILLQYLEANDTYLWSTTMENVRNPAAIQIRYFVDLGYQPVLLNLTPDIPFPIPPKKNPVESNAGGNFTTSAIADSLYALTGLNWTEMNFNNTPSQFMLTITDTDNKTMAGFIYNAFQAPPPRPVIKGGNGNVELQNIFDEVPYVVAAWITFLFMLLNIIGGFAAVRALKYDQRRKETEQQLRLANAAKTKGTSISK